jgi:glycosyltransferase 2 family protein
LKAQDLVKRALGSRLLKLAFVIVALAFGVYAIVKDWHQLHHALGQIGLLSCLWALLALLAMQFAALKVYQGLLAGLGSPLSLRVSGGILFIGQLGKYVPGSLWPILAQMELGARAKVPRARSASASVLAMLVSLVAGLITAMVTLPFAEHNAEYYWVFAVLPVVLVCLYPKVLNRLLDKLFKLVKRPGLEEPLRGGVLAKALAWAFTAWLFNGLQIWLLAERFGAPAGRTFLLALGGYAFAWCVGFVVIIDPAGAGVREVLLIAALSPVIGGPAALACALVSRALNTVTDLLCAGTAAAGWRHQRRAEARAGKDQDDQVLDDAVAPVPSASDRNR